jgi:hypothetical protein
MHTYSGIIGTGHNLTLAILKTLLGNLVGSSTRKLSVVLNVARDFEASEMLARVLQDHFRREIVNGLAVTQYQTSLDLFATFLVLDAVHGDILDLRNCRKRTLHLRDRDVLGAAADHVLDPANNVIVAVSIPPSEISRAEPLAMERRLGRLRLLVVSLEHAGACDAEFADRAIRQLIAVRVSNLGSAIGQDLAAAPRPDGMSVMQAAPDGEPDLSHAERIPYRDPIPLRDGCLKGRAHAEGGDHRELVIALDRIGLKHGDRVGHPRHVVLVVADTLAEYTQAVGWRNAKCRTAERCHRKAPERTHVVEGKITLDPLETGPHFRGNLATDDPVSVRQEASFRPPGRPRRILNADDVVELDLRISAELDCGFCKEVVPP